MAGSTSERLIRDYAAGRLREMKPRARIIHELVVGRCRADLAAIEPERITLVEIKSEKDTLKRLQEQVRQFSRASHEVVVIAHERWFDATPYQNGRARFVPGEVLGASARGGRSLGFSRRKRSFDVRRMAHFPVEHQRTRAACCMPAGTALAG